jgi:hypothetical protein
MAERAKATMRRTASRKVLVTDRHVYSHETMRGADLGLEKRESRQKRCLAKAMAERQATLQEERQGKDQIEGVAAPPKHSFSVLRGSSDGEL